VIVRFLFALALGLLAAADVGRGAASAQVSDGVVRIGVLNDQSSLYADVGGPGSVVAARMAVEDAGGAVLGKPVDVVVADHQNKADVGAAIARQWFDVDQVDIAIGFENSSVALAVEQIAAQKNRIAIAGAVGTTAFTGRNCTPNEASWLYDSHALTTTLARAVVGRGQNTWFFITVDYAFGHSLEAEAARAVVASGGKVLGSVRHPLNTADFSSYLLQAQASGAKVVALANGRGRPDQRLQASQRIRVDHFGPNYCIASRFHYRHPQHGAQGRAGPGLRHGVLLGP
jgi:branched-chain amino acid transport system substrate-binding protein